MLTAIVIGFALTCFGIALALGLARLGGKGRRRRLVQRQTPPARRRARSVAMNGALVVAPVLVPLLGVLVTLLAWRRPGRQARLSLGLRDALRRCRDRLAQWHRRWPGIQARFGDWPAPAAIAFSIDRLGAAMLTVSGVVLVAVLLFPVHRRRPQRPRAVAASNAARAHDGRRRRLLDADLFNLYVWFEVMLISALGVIVIGARRMAFLEAGLKVSC